MILRQSEIWDLEASDAKPDTLHDAPHVDTLAKWHYQDCMFSVLETKRTQRNQIWENGIDIQWTMQLP